MMDHCIEINILFFAKSRELSGLSETVLELPTSRIVCSDLLKLICENYNLTLIQHNLILAVNGEYCNDPTEQLELQNGVEVAVIPPISGG